MKDFSKLKKESGNEKKPKVQYDNNIFRVVKYDGWEFIEEEDSVCCIPILTQYNKIILRQEVVPPFNYKDGDDYFLTVLAGTVEKGENPKQTLRRELEEEAGIILKDSYVIEIYDEFFKSKSGTSKFHLCLLPLMEHEYDETIAKGDDSEKEKLSKSVKVDFKYIKQLLPSDIVTKLMIEEVKKYLNIFN